MQDTYPQKSNFSSGSRKTTPCDKTARSALLEPPNKGEKAETVMCTPLWTPARKMQATPNVKVKRKNPVHAFQKQFSVMNLVLYCVALYLTYVCLLSQSCL